MVKGVHRIMKEMQAAQQQAVALLKPDGATNGNGHGRQHSATNGQTPTTPSRSQSQSKREQSGSPRTDGTREPSRGRPPERFSVERRKSGRASRRYSHDSNHGSNHDSSQEVAADALGA